MLRCRTPSERYARLPHAFEAFSGDHRPYFFGHENVHAKMVRLLKKVMGLDNSEA
jgi:hypothetical protein